MEERQATIRQALEDAEEAKRRAAEAEEEYSGRSARPGRRPGPWWTRPTAWRSRCGPSDGSEADDEYQRILGRARADIDAQVRQASETLRQQVGDLAVSVVEKVLGDGLDPQSHRSLIDRTIAEVEAQAGASEVRT